jgi:peptide subunit release factor 1 (eRF1)
MIQNSPTFTQYNREKQEIISALADAFETDSEAIYYSPEQLEKALELGNVALWKEFLNLEQTRSYIKSQMGFNAQIASRKAFAALQREASQGDTQAAKQVNELAGVLANADQNRIIVLHQINRGDNNGNE